jgi:hypothetical protein
MKNGGIQIAFIGLLGLFLSTSLFAQGRGPAPARGARGDTPQRVEQGNRGERGERGQNAAEQRKEIQAQQKAAIERENSRFKLAMMAIQQDARNASNDTAKALAKQQAEVERRNHQTALQTIRVQAKSAASTLKK